MTEQTINCKNCGTPFTGNYCNHCGEKFHSENEKKLSNVFSEGFHFVTHLDNKFLKSLRLVLFKPGTLAYKYCSGIRKPYFKPIGFFFICVLLYLLFPAFKGLNPMLGTFTSPQNKYYHIAKPVVDRKVKKEQINYTVLADKYNAKSPKVAKFLLFLYIPFCALILRLLFFRRKKYFFDHFILSTEINSLFILVGYVIIPFIILLILQIPNVRQNITENVIAAMLITFFAVAMYSAFRKFYREKIGWSILKSVLFLATYIYVVVPIYNMIIFFTVMSLI